VETLTPAPTETREGRKPQGSKIEKVDGDAILTISSKEGLHSPWTTTGEGSFRFTNVDAVSAVAPPSTADPKYQKHRRHLLTTRTTYPTI
jgi:hypothetical protein